MNALAVALCMAGSASASDAGVPPDARHHRLDGEVPAALALRGGIGSDLWHAPGDPPDQFWMLTDRGPNGELKLGRERRRTFPSPSFAPSIVNVLVRAGGLRVLKVVALAAPDGTPLSGLPNREDHDERPWTGDGKGALPFDPCGLDTEGMVRTADGGFWVADEYGPSLARVDAEGRLRERYVPAGVGCDCSRVEVRAALPAILARRELNRGFEGLALDRAERTLYAAMQSPLGGPGGAAAGSSRAVRILAFDVAARRPSAEYVVLLEPFAAFDPGAKDQGDLKVSALAWRAPGKLWLLERTTARARVYEVELRPDADVLGTRWDHPATVPALEQLADPAAAGVPLLEPRLVVDLSSVPGMPPKLEGLAILDERTLAVCNDDDFGVGEVGEQATELVIVALPRAPR